MAMGKTIRIPKTAINIPIVRKRCCQTGSISRSTVALTTALSKLSDTSRIESTTTIHNMPSVAVIDPVLVQPYQPASAKQTAVKANEKA